MSPSDDSRCPVCATPLRDGRRQDQGARAYFDCPRCGLFGLMRPAEFTLPSLLTNPRRASVLSYAIRRTPPRGRDTTLFDAETCKKIIEQDFLPTPQEQAENLIRWLGANLPGPGEIVRIDFAEHGAILGAQSPDGFHFVVRGLIASGLLEGAHLLGPFQPSDVTLTFAGWEQFEELRRGTPSGRWPSSRKVARKPTASHADGAGDPDLV